MKYYGGIDLGGTNTKIGLLDENANLIFSESIKTLAENGYKDTVERVSKIFLDKMIEYKIDKKDLVAVGFGIPGPAVNKREIKMFANLPWPKNLKIADDFKEKLNVPVWIDNDVNVITLGEVFAGAAKGYNEVVGIAIGTGIGAGVVTEGKIVSGKLGAAGELGHITLVPRGSLCGCGQRGCFEAYGSALAIIREANSRLAVNKNTSLYEISKERDLEAKDIFDAAKAGDKMAVSIVDDTADMIALGISHALNMLNPELIIIGGGVSLAGDYLFDKVKTKLNDYALPTTLEELEIKQAILGNDAGVYGAAYLAMTEINRGK